MCFPQFSRSDIAKSKLTSTLFFVIPESGRQSRQLCELLRVFVCVLFVYEIYNVHQVLYTNWNYYVIFTANLQNVRRKRTCVCISVSRILATCGSYTFCLPLDTVSVC